MSGMITRWFLGMVMGSTVGSAIALGANCSYAQITPDATLPNNSTVKLEGNIRTIEGGTRAGGNLFHSFKEFSVPTGGTAFFNNATDIQNIISRVTGGSVSNIDGIIRTLGTANLFLINPNGIVFGANASLNVAGSFVATTANAIQFGNQGFFSASAPNNPELLTVNPNALLFNQIRAASIQNNSVADAGLNASSEFTVNGLRVPDGRSLLLVGGDIKMDGGGLNAFGGRVELGGLASAGTIGLDGNGNNLSLSFPNSVERSNVSLSNGATVAVIAGNGGSIAVNARNLEMTGESELFAGIDRGLGSNSSRAGNIDVNATGAINLNNRSFIANQVKEEANGQGGDVSISASTLRVEGGSQVGAGTFGEGNGGNLTVAASQAVNLSGRRSRLYAQTQGGGAAGNLQISTGQLTVQDGAQISASSFAQGQGGNLTVNASESVELIGRAPDSDVSSGLFAQAQGAGAAGNLAITTGRLIVRDGAGVSTTTFTQSQGGSLSVNAFESIKLTGGGGLSTQADGDGVAGNLTVATGKLIVQDGSQVLTTTYGQGQGGILSVNASDSVELIGRESGLFTDTQSDGAAGNLTITTGKLIVRDQAQVFSGTTAKGQGGNLTVNALESVEISSRADSPRFISGLFTVTQGAGAAGDLTITTDRLTVKGRSEVSVTSEGTGKAGNLNMKARSILLDNQAGINAQTASGNGGNITLQNLDLLLMRHGSQISTSAGTAQAGGNGGNITINATNGFIVAVPNENSDITANAFNGSGGSVNINATSIFGITPRSREDLVRLLGTNETTKLDPLLLSTSDITAISQTSPTLNGTVTVNNLGIDPTQGLVNLPVVPVDTKVAQGCYAGVRQAQSEFIITGRGGLPPNPGEPLSTDAVSVNLVTLENQEARHEERNRATQSQSHTTEHPHKSSSANPPTQIVEAQGWIVNKNGDVELVAFAPTATPHNPRFNPASCQRERK